MSETKTLPVLVIGAGPVGLAAAAHLHERGLPFLVLESGEGPGAAVREWGHVRVFSPWHYNIDHAARRLLDAAAWAAPEDNALPTGDELVEDYLAPLATLAELSPHIRYRARVTALGRDGIDRVRTPGRVGTAFLVRLDTGEELRARAVIDASGTWRTPNVLGATGLPAHGEADIRLGSAMPDVLGADREHYAGRHTIVVGAGHSAANTLLALAQLTESTITWAVRSGTAARAYGGEGADELPARGALGSGLRLLVESGRVTLLPGFAVHTVRSGGGQVELVAADGRTVTADRVVAATGYRPDHSIASELRLDLDPIMESTRALAPLIDPNQHSCGSVPANGVDELAHPEPGYYAVGMKSYGRAPTFLMATGYEQVRSIVAALAGDWDAAREVHLELPETGVCSTKLATPSLLADAAIQFGLAPEVPGLLIAAALRHLPIAGNVGDATRAAAAELGIDANVALNLAALASDEFEQPATADGRPSLQLIGAPAAGGCC